MRERLLISAAAVGFVLLIGWIDFITGPDIGLSLLYLIPITLAGWLGGKTSAVTVAVTASCLWLAADLMGRPGSTAVSLWNGFTRLVIYVTQGLMTAKLREDGSLLRKLALQEAALARTDAVTELPNSRAFMEMLNRRASDGPYPLVVMLVDLDNFKKVNDLYGHSRGDDALQLAAAAVQIAVGDGVAARVGGDEFAVLLSEVSIEEARERGQRIVDSMRHLAANYAGTDLGASVGIAYSRDNIMADALLHAADEAMYEGKRRGKRAVVVREMESEG